MTFPDLESSETASVDFFSEGINFELDHPLILEQWIKSTILQENKALHYINYIFCSDSYLYDMNVNYLQHDTLTDVISFPYSNEAVEGEIYISIDRIKDNAVNLGISFAYELHRVMIHGTLHLIGYLDKSVEEKQEMTQLEDLYLQSLKKIFQEKEIAY